ncbi:Stationary phase protein 4 [Nakaseomyces bracarensis]|uniref:Stationary phase protein 4 n=1 Tax=Nakaseomyces bracarensis TaxID=273131 RepID=A0ABR4NMX3_9SACH
MPSFWDSFAVYNRNKHAKGGADMHGGNHMNTGTGQTMYMHASEHYDIKKKDDGTVEAKIETPSGPQMVDVSNMTQQEFEKLYKTMRKGEPNNRVNI